jgi:hypothetical protein
MVKETGNSIAFQTWNDKAYKTHGHVCGTTCAGTLQSRALAKILGHNHKEVETRQIVPPHDVEDTQAAAWPSSPVYEG